MEHLPWYVSTLFVFTFLVAAFLFSKAAHYSRNLLAILLLLTIIQSALGISGFYSNVGLATTRFPMLIFPPLVIFATLFFTPKGRRFIDSFDIKALTILHIIRVGVEMVLLWLFTHHTIPEAMTFEGRNFDILSGLTAPLVYYFGFVKQRLSRQVILAWNIGCLLLLLNVVTTALLSLPGRFNSFGFEQPNTAVGYFPFLLLPAILVPLVLFSHAVAIRQLIMHKDHLPSTHSNSN